MILPEKIKLSPFSHTFSNNNVVAVYDSLSHNVFYGDRELVSFLERIKAQKKIDPKDLKHAKKLYDDGILVSEKFDPDEILNKVRKFVDKPHIDSLYVVTTDKCNYACKYCFIEGNMPSDHEFSMMTEDILKKGINLFVKSLSKDAEKTEVVFYGGEPLLNRKIIEIGNDLLDEKREIGIIKQLNKMIFTNGSLVTGEVADFFNKNNINVGFSLDGWKEINDKARVSISKKGTFDNTINGYKNLKLAGCNIGISCTVSFHNIDVLEKVMEYFATELEAKFVSLNPLFDTSRMKLSKKFLEHMADKIIQAYDVSKKYGIYEDRVTKFIEPFVKGYIRVVDCAGCGRQLVLAPNGQIGPCHAFLGNKKFFCGSVYDKDFDPTKNATFQEWSTRSPFNMKECLNCSAISICGGGCPYNSLIRKQSIYEVDERICVLAKKVLEKIIWEGFENVKRKNKSARINKTSEDKLRHFRC